MFIDEAIKGKETVTINIPSVDDWSLRDLKYLCKKHHVKGYTKMSREQLVVAAKEIMETISKS